MQYQKVKSVGKIIRTKGPELTKTVLKTIGTVADIVGATLGPGGMPVLIERQEFNLPPMVTKDGVTVSRSLGFEGSVEQVLMESARDAAVRTANEAGDGTTTATVLANAIVQKANAYTTKNPKVSPQRVVRHLQKVFKEIIEPLIKGESRDVKGLLAESSKEARNEGRRLLWNVAKISANGDAELANAVLECFDLVGDDGNVTLTEVSGPSGFEVEPIKGYPIPTGYEDSCGKYQSKFINEAQTQRVVLENPIFIVYHGRITEIQTLVPIMNMIAQLWQSDRGFRHNIVLVATGFSESVIAQLALNFAEMTSINVFPLQAPLSPVPGGQLGFLEDMCAISGSKMFDPLTPENRIDVVENLRVEDLGCFAKTFEATRFRSTVIANEEDQITREAVGLLVEDQVSKINAKIADNASVLDRQILEERIGKLTGGIARLKILGASSGELRERRDRAEDAVCAVRGAVKFGCLPGGGWMLIRAALELPEDEISQQVLYLALLSPVERLLTNCGFTAEEVTETVKKLIVGVEEYATSASLTKKPMVYDAYEQKYVEPWSAGVLDSTPAVLEAIRNSLSIASQLGTLGGVCVFRRDHELERVEARETNNWLREDDAGAAADFGANPADEKAV